ncbi:hypothetical protein [Ectopseudomonas oleovorans]|uniref:Uncharacterized protein n=1 Tax=Ectopseudomonas oleovorans (strain CECT 5344) TaxID=1182590 RepID=W6RKN5_ECTO5|nr:hypothetical protein [Pseudomonas oleovorans]CDM42379.1 hypothetical protein BN5_3837 [Pseudomonas oleovorans CECT 5344]CDR93002.1 hypothetical protein PPSAL_3778 [Pseudomonas oleovorans]
MWLQVAILVGTYLLSSARAAKAKPPRPAAFEEIDFPVCEEGEEQTAVFGQVWSESWMVLTVGNHRTSAIKVKGSKK